MSIDVDWDNHPDIAQAVDVLTRGGVIAYPTEAVWGLGCDPLQPQAVNHLLQLKQRDPDKGVILVAAAIEQFEPYLEGINSSQRQQLQASWPGPVTWLVPDNGSVPHWIRGQHDSVALRVSNHPLVAALCRAFGGPLVSTSANPQGQAPAENSKSVSSYFGDRLDAITPGKVGEQGNPTEIRDLLSGKILRAG